MISIRESRSNALSSNHPALLIETLPAGEVDAATLFEWCRWEGRAVLLEGMQGGWFDGHFSLLAGMPFAQFESKEGTSRFAFFAGGRPAFLQKGDPLGHLQQWLDRFQSPSPEGSLSKFPFLQGGAAGFFSYDLIRQWESIPPPQFGNRELPDILLLFFNLFIVLDHREERLLLIYNPSPEVAMGESEESARKEGAEKIADLKARLTGLSAPIRIEPKTSHHIIESDLSQKDYIQRVLQVKEYIAAGDIFQANLSHRFRLASPSPSPLSLYRRLREINPSPFSSYLDLGKVQIASGSPERLIQVVRSGEKRFVSTRPIAGTHPRGKNKSEDERMIRALYRSEKERAEHLMLVDLERNDLGKVCRYGSVRVDELMSLEKYSHVFHLVSNVRGELRPEIKLTDAFQAVFPGGTITGVPKIRCMEILSELERSARGIYTGALGYLSFTGEMDLNIAIRTWVRQEEEMTFQVGAGIVADSDPEKEYQETLQKAAALIKALEKSEESGVRSQA